MTFKPILALELHKAEETEFDAFIITEGKTDWRHLERALHEIGYRRRLRYDTTDQDRGDTKLLDICQALALEPRNRPVICAVLTAAADGSETTKKIMAKDVASIEDEAGRKIGLSKARFAEMIFNKIEPFAEVDFSAFRLVADQLERILTVTKQEHA